MSIRSLSRRLDRTGGSVPLLHSLELRAYVTFMAETHGLAVAELLAETKVILARARKAVREQIGSDLAEWLAAERGWSAAEIQAEAAASLASWREQER